MELTYSCLPMSCFERSMRKNFSARFERRLEAYNRTHKGYLSKASIAIQVLSLHLGISSFLNVYGYLQQNRR